MADFDNVFPAVKPVSANERLSWPDELRDSVAGSYDSVAALREAEARTAAGDEEARAIARLIIASQRGRADG
jgi:hypothetical protein